MDRTLLDTDILSDFLRGKNSHVLQRAQAYLQQHQKLSISALTVFEVVRGRHQANQAHRATEFLAWTLGADVLPFDADCARIGGEIAGALLRAGTTVGVADVFIAATAIVHNPTLVSANVSHYQRIAAFGLRLENWRDPV